MMQALRLQLSWQEAGETANGDAECVLRLNMQKYGHRTLLFSGDEMSL